MILNLHGSLLEVSFFCDNHDQENGPVTAPSRPSSPLFPQDTAKEMIQAP